MSTQVVPKAFIFDFSPQRLQRYTPSFLADECQWTANESLITQQHPGTTRKFHARYTGFCNDVGFAAICTGSR